MLTIRIDDLAGQQVRDLLALHLAGMRADTPHGGLFALDLSGLTKPEVTVWTAWEGERIAGIGALKQFAPRAAEIKSMRTHPDFLGRGVGAALLDTIVAAARERGIARLSLETGSGPVFEPALALYRRRGFIDGAPFADYVPNGFSQFLHRDLDAD